MKKTLFTKTSICLILLSFVFVACKKKKPAQKSGKSKLQIIRVTGIPDENPTELQRKYKPMVEFLSKALGAKVEYVPVTDYGAAVQALIAGKIDFTWLGGFTHVQARNFAKVEPLVMRDIDRNFKSVFIASTSTKINTIPELKEKTFAFGSKSSTSGHLMPRHFLLTQFKLDPDKHFKGKPVFSGAHDATVKMVESGKVTGGALNAEVWKRLLNTKKVDTKKVKVVWTTPGYVDYVWTARSAIHLKLRKKFTKAFLGLDSKNPLHQKVLKLQGAKKFVKAQAKDFDAIEKVALSTGLLRKK